MLEFGEYKAAQTNRGIRFWKGNILIAQAKVPAEAREYLLSRLKQAEETAKAEAAKLGHGTRDILQLPESEADPKETPEKETTPEEAEKPKEEPKIESKIESSIDPNYLESISIYTASLEDLTKALYERFGIYTVYLKQLPRAVETNPLTGMPFTKYHLGIAYQAAIYAENQGILNKTPAPPIETEMKLDPVAHTLKEARQANDFNFRTTVQATRTIPDTQIEHIIGEDGEVHAVQVPYKPKQSIDEEGDIILEPPIMGTAPIIRPDW